MLKVVVTGASGFIGKALVKELSKHGYYVYAVVRNKNKINMFDEYINVKTILCELSNLYGIYSILSGNDFEYFFHLAWDGTSGVDRENYEKQLSNVTYTCEAVKVAKKLGCKKFIYAGSLMEYESIKYISLNGSKPAKNYIYRTAKLAAHYMAKAVAVDLNIDFVTGIVSNAYGEGEISPRLINSTVRKLLNGEKTAFTLGEQLYDFIYITDVAKAFIIMAEEGKPYFNYYIGNKEQRKLKDFLLDIRDCFDKTIDIGLGEMPFDGVTLDYTEFETGGIYEDTSFKCEVSFKDGIYKTVDWINSQC